MDQQGLGKGTITELVAKELGLITIDTGATYRCVTLAMLEQNIGMQEIEKIEKLLQEIEIEFDHKQGENFVYLNGKDVTKKIREKEVTEKVSFVSGIKTIRIHMAQLQRKMAQGKDVIMEGRDIGTYVFPNANVKIYLDAEAEERAKRRVKQNEEKGIVSTYEEVLQNILQRDKNDKEKEIGALKVAPDAIVIDTTHLTIEEVKNKVEQIIKQNKKKEDRKLSKEEEKNKKIYAIRPETKWKKFIRACLKGFFHGLYAFLFRIERIGEKVPEEGAYILCANHKNYLDAIALVSTNKRKVYFLAKEELFHHRILNWIGHVFDVIPVKRGKQDLDSMKRSLGVLRKGELLGLFPEGTRKGIAKNGKVKNGAAFMALRTGAPVIPVGIQGSFRPFTKVRLNYGKPIDFKEYVSKNPDKEVLEQASKQIMDAIIMLTNEKR